MGITSLFEFDKPQFKSWLYQLRENIGFAQVTKTL